MYHVITLCRFCAYKLWLLDEGRIISLYDVVCSQSDDDDDDDE